jgi:hypothetical protein
MKVIENSKDLASLSTDNLIQDASNIDNEITTRLVRVIWKALSVSSPELRHHLNCFLQEEIDVILFQDEIGQSDSHEMSASVADILKNYIIPME